MKNFKLLSGVLCAGLCYFIPFLVIYITTGYWVTTQAVGAGYVARIFAITIPFILGTYILWRSLNDYFSK